MTDEKMLEEEKRVGALLGRENELHARGITLVGGIDEAGRGPLVGPVVASCVILPPDFFVPYLNDSKKVTEKRREAMFPQIIEGAVSVGVGLATPEEIDDVNILNATYMAMKRAVKAMKVKPAYVLNDAVHIPDLGIEQESVVKGDAKIACISAASVVAKVTRDNIMREYDSLVPKYHFSRHKGYPTRAHYEILEQYGVLPIYRRSFLTKRIEAGTLVVTENKVDLPDPYDLADEFLKGYGLSVVR
jgi:ribonuclease HII